MAEAKTKCKPPLSKEELKTIWESAKKCYNNTISKSADYISPDKYRPNTAPFVYEDKNGLKISCPALASYKVYYFMFFI